jgi:hypothetical protein
MASETISGGVHADTRQLKEFIKSLRDTYPVAATGLKEKLRAGGEIVASEARKIAGEHSTSIPPTIRTSVYGAVVSVKGGNKSTPLAALYELGNKGKRSADSFRHPVFGRENDWVDQARYPFLVPALEKSGPAMEAELEKVADDIVDILTLNR